MSKLDTEKILPNQPLQDGDKVSTVKKYVNKQEFALNWLLNESIDHRKVTVDGDTDWDDLKDYSVYYFNSLTGPNAPAENQLGSHDGIVVCSSAGIGSHFQFALTKTGACFRDTRGSWFYIGHGIPNDIDINKLVDQETLGSVLRGYATNGDLTQLKNSLVAYMAQTYTTIKQFDSGMNSANSQMSHDMSYESTVASTNSANASQSARSLSTSTSANHSSDSYSLKSNASSLSTYGSSLSSQVNSNWKSETGSVQPDGTYDVSSILSSGVEIPSLKSGTGSIYANTSNLNSLNDTVSSESVVDVEIHNSLSTMTSSLSSSASSASQSDLEIYPNSSFINNRISYYNSLGDKISSADASFQAAVSNYSTTIYSSTIASYFFNSYSAADSYYNSCADYYKNLYLVSSQSDTQNLQDGSLTSLSSGIGSVYANDSNLISLSNKVDSVSSADSGVYPHYDTYGHSNANSEAIAYLNNNEGDNLMVISLSDDSPNDKVNDNKQLASLNNDNIRQLYSSMDNATFIQVGSSSEPVTMYAAANSSELDSLQESQTFDNNTDLMVNSNYANQYSYCEVHNNSIVINNSSEAMTDQISASSIGLDDFDGTYRQGSVYNNTSNVNFLASVLSSSASQLSNSTNSLIVSFSSDSLYEPYQYASSDNVTNEGNRLVITDPDNASNSNIGSVAYNASLIDSNFKSIMDSAGSYYRYEYYDSLVPTYDSKNNNSQINDRDTGMSMAPDNAVGSVAANASLIDSNHDSASEYFSSLQTSNGSVYSYAQQDSITNSTETYSYSSNSYVLSTNSMSVISGHSQTVSKPLGSIAANASLIDSNYSSASSSITQLSSSANSSLDNLTLYTDSQLFSDVYPRMASDESAITNNYDIGSQNATMINSAVGSMDSDGNTELSTIKVFCIARGANANELNMTGHVVGYFVLSNPGNSVSTEGLPGLYNVDDLSKACGNNNAISYGGRGGTLNQFVGADGLIYHAEHSIKGTQVTENVHGTPTTITITNDDDTVNFTDVSDPVIERYCKLITPVEDVQARRIHDLLAADSSYLDSHITSVASSLISQCITSSEYVGSRGGTVNIVNDNFTYTSQSAKDAVSSEKDIYSHISAELSNGKYGNGNGPESAATNGTPTSNVFNNRILSDLSGNNSAIAEMKSEQNDTSQEDTVRNRIDSNLRKG